MKIILWTNEKDFAIEDWHRSQYILLTGLPGRKRFVERNMVFDPCGANLDYIMANWPDVEWEGVTASRLKSYQQAQAESKAASALKRSVELPEDPERYQYHTTPYSHQARAFLLSRDRKAYGLLFEQGCGKSKPTLDNAAYLYEHGDIDALVVVAPNGVHRNWVDNEVPAHLPPRIKHRAFFYSANLTPKRLEQLKADISQCLYRKVLLIITFNIEGFASEKARDLLDEVLMGFRCLMVVDESSRIRNPKALRTKFLLEEGKQAAFRRILTGTPVSKGPENLYTQLSFLDPNILGFSTFTAFKNHYCIMGGFEGKQVVGYRNMEELREKMDGYTMRVLKKECLDLPPKIYKRIPFEMSPEQRRTYDELKREFMTEYQGELLTVSIALTMMVRLSQIAGGWWPSERLEEASPKKQVRQFNPNPRFEVLKDCLEDVEGKAIIWSKFRGDIDMITEHLGRDAVRYDGAVSTKDRALAIERFQKSDSTQYFVAQIQSAATGLTLTAAETAIYYTNSFELEARLQSEDRCHRIGTIHPVTYIDLEAVKSVDRKVINSLRKSKSLADLITGDPASAFMEEE